MTALNKQALRMRNYLDMALKSGVKLLHLSTDELKGLLDEMESVGRTLAVNHEAACSLVDENDELKRKLEAAEKRIAELQSSVIAPGVMRCAGCGFVLTKNNINMAAGTITAGDSNTEPCPNGCGPLWPVTWKEQALQMRDDSEQWFDELQQSRQRIAELEARKVTVKLPADYRNSDGSINDDMFNTCEVVGAFREALAAVGIGVKGE
ncbi:hypothetical protein [Citrobacter freundii]|uniref:hypothetical protein n=1 Tax=Citrobacter freundii TaxID=546 RepID=UPI0014957317|nr:hypothetical protein [Citrobacter freundii]MBJ9191789.1 hypothetical protein [Citrobacter freundii]